MANKKRYQKKNHTSPNKNQNNQQNYSKASQQQLTIQCLEIHQIIKNRHKSLKQEKLDYCYLLSTKWYEDWKQYVGYYQLTSQNQQKNNKKKGKKHPGKINFQLTTTNNKYYTIPETMPDYQYLNIILKQKLQKDDDYIAVSKELWQAFANKYDSIQIKRPKRVTKKGSVVYDGGLLNLDIIFVDYGNKELMKNIQNMKTKKANLDEQFPCKKMQLSELWQLEQLMQFLQQYCEIEYETKNIKVWKGQTYITSGALQKQIWDGLHQDHQKFPISGRVLEGEKYNDLDLDEFLRSYYTLIIQIDGNRFMTKKPTQDTIKGYCQQCVQNKQLIVRCQCDTVFYCSHQCRITDQTFHYKICIEAFDSEDDQEYNEKKMSVHKNGFPVCGLNNLGNTCYMNSVLQSLMSIQEVMDYFLSNCFFNEIDQKQLKQTKGIFIYKYSKLCKQLTQSKASYSPWSIKGQINYFLSPFKGFKQHDANDLLVNFINAINEQLKKPEGKVYHKLFEQNFIGTFHSQIKCPECTVLIKNQQIFSQITVPLKPKAKSSTTTYVIYNSVNQYIRGKCNLFDSWYQIRKSLNLDEMCLLMGARQGQHAVEIDEEQQPQKTVKKIKRELVFYPNCQSEGQGQVFFSFVLITQKTICGQKMKSPYGYPAVISIVPILHTVGSFIIKIIKEHCSKQIYEQAQKIKQNYMKELQQNSKSSSVISSQESTQASKQEEEKAKQQQEKRFVDTANQNLKSLLEKHNIHIFINDNKRHRNICHFCKKKCQGCEMLPDFSLNLTLYLQGKLNDVTFDVLLADKVQPNKNTIDIAKSGEPTLQQCFQLFNQPEQLDQQNAWYCQACDMMRLAYKQLSVAQLPKVLIVHLNRFKNQNNKRVKNSDPIDYQQIQQFYGKKYKLLSVIVHEGSTQGGHYWAICLRNDKYYIFNDSKVTETKNICNKNAYVLIYRALDEK